MALHRGFPRRGRGMRHRKQARRCFTRKQHSPITTCERTELGKKPAQNVIFSAICIILAGEVPLIVPAVAFPIVAEGKLKLARLSELNISHRYVSAYLSLIRK